MMALNWTNLPEVCYMVTGTTDGLISPSHSL